MGLCQSTPLKVIVFDHEGNKKTTNVPMKKMRTFHTMADVLAYAEVAVSRDDTIYTRSHIGLEEVAVHSQFQIRDLIVKNARGALKYRIVMESLY